MSELKALFEKEEQLRQHLPGVNLEGIITNRFGEKIVLYQLYEFETNSSNVTAPRLCPGVMAADFKIKNPRFAKYLYLNNWINYKINVNKPGAYDKLFISIYNYIKSTS